MQRTSMRTRNRRKIQKFLDEPMRPGDPDVKPKGTLLVIGGREDKEGDKLILRSLARRVGGGKLVIAPLASSEPEEAWETYERLMRGLGVAHVYHLNIEERADGASTRAMSVLDGATAVFFTGGDQTRITSLLGDTPAFSRIYEIFAEGGTIAGTSAGASVMSETMLVGGDDDASHRIKGRLQLGPGLGFARDMVIDQHFAERGRIGRLLGVVAQNPRIIGIGIDEDTAMELRPSTGFRVLGSGGVTVVNGATVTETNVAEEDPERTVSLFNATLHVLSQGDRFDLRTRTPHMGAASVIDEELGLDAERENESAADS
jgi:cyanophycinase